MKLLLVFVFLAAGAALKVDKRFISRHGIPPARAPNSRAQRPTWGLITQRQDNFDPTNLKTWQMRYIENGQFFKPGGPIFIMLGAEWIIDEGWLQTGQMFDLSEIHNAYMFYTEHRYYGKSIPTEDLSTPNLRYLSADQALADVAHFLVTVKENNTELANSKVIVFGGSYAGSMATWMRQKYPHLVHGAVASSAPLLAKVDFFEYNDVVKHALGIECSSILLNASRAIRRLLNEGNTAKVENDFNFCSPISNDFDVQTLFNYIANEVGAVVQNSDPYEIGLMCEAISDPTLASDYDRAVAYFNDGTCKSDFDSATSFLNYTSIHLAILPARQWVYQGCTNFGFFLTAWGEESLLNYGISIDYYHQQCLELFGITSKSTSANIAATNKEHGALNPAVTRLISVHGSIDPWHAIGVTEDVNPSSPSYLVEGTSHCADMNSECATEEMCNVKKDIAKHVAEWLNDSS